jgi:opacity protein-like surface antigen
MSKKNSRLAHTITLAMPARSPAAAWLLAALCAAAMGTAQAADTPEPTKPAAAAATNAPSTASALTAARSQITAKNWPGALAELRHVNQTQSADWNNLMGYALRKSANPDLAGAQSHYEAALRIEPTHRGALEYSGELFLMRGELAQAEARAATLARVCQRCEELDDLRGAIERYKAAGNRWAPKP